jgi:hypothetical protein
MSENESGTEGGAGEAGAPAAGKEDKILAKIKKEWEAAGSKNPTAEEGKKLVTALTTAQEKVKHAEEAMTKAKAAESAAIEKLARAFGGKSLRIGGVVHDFASRGDTIFFRKKTSSEVVDL